MLYCRQDTNEIHYSVRFAATVTDGTPCRQGVNGICVDGKCEVSRPTRDSKPLSPCNGV